MKKFFNATNNMDKMHDNGNASASACAKVGTMKLNNLAMVGALGVMNIKG